MNVLTVNLFSSTLIFWIAARIYLFPKLSELTPQAVLVPILLLHSTRHLGLMFLSTGAVYPGMPPSFAYPAAIGDLIAALLALTCLLALRRRWTTAVVLLWIFSIEGFVDLIAAIALATTYDAEPFMGAAYWIPAFWVPSLLVTHMIVFILLWRYGARIVPQEMQADGGDAGNSGFLCGLFGNGGKWRARQDSNL